MFLPIHKLMCVSGLEISLTTDFKYYGGRLLYPVEQSLDGHKKTGLEFIKVFDGILEFFLGRLGAIQ